jgi:hypothetical protein
MKMDKKVDEKGRTLETPLGPVTRVELDEALFAWPEKVAELENREDLASGLFGGVECAPVAMVFTHQQMFMIPRISENSAEWMTLIRSVADKLSGTAVLVVSEGWTPKTDAGNATAMSLASAGEKFSDLMDKDTLQEILTVSIATCWGRSRVRVWEVEDEQLVKDPRDTGWVNDADDDLTGTMTEVFRVR